jgi:hypothetical protein
MTPPPTMSIVFDEHRLREAVDLQDGVRVVDVLVVEGDALRVVRLGAGRDQEEFARDARRAGSRGGEELDGVRIDEPRFPLVGGDAVPLEVPDHPVHLLLANGILA